MKGVHFKMKIIKIITSVVLSILAFNCSLISSAQCVYLNLQSENDLISPISVSDNIERTNMCCGENVSASLINGVLTISGSGEMNDYFLNEPAPWQSFAKDIESINIGADITKIGSYSFYKCENLKNVNINVQKIGVNAFEECSNLIDVTIGDKVEMISNFCFKNCNNITSINLGKSINYIEKPFSGMNRLEYISVDEGNKYFSSDRNGLLYNKDKSELIFVPINYQSTILNVSSNVSCINKNALNENKSIETINIPLNTYVYAETFKNTHFLEVWDKSSSNINYHDSSDNHYLIVNGCVCDFKCSINDQTGTFDLMQDIQNINGEHTDINSVCLLGNNYNFITQIIIKDNINIKNKSFNQTGWYNSTVTGNKVLYNNEDPSMATYSTLYEYNGDNYDIDLTAYNGIEHTPFGNINFSSFDETKDEGITLHFDPNKLSHIDSYAFYKAKIKDIYLSKDYSYKLTYNDLIIPNEEHVVLNGNVLNFTLTNWDNVQKQLIFAIFNQNFSVSYQKDDNYSLRGKITNDYCSAIIQKMNWKEIAENNPYEAIYQIQNWISYNIPYGYLETIKPDNNSTRFDISFDNEDYFLHFLTSCSFGAVTLGQAICTGHSDLYQRFIKGLECDQLDCITVANNMHQWNLVRVDDEWYYADVEAEFGLYTQKEFSGLSYSGYTIDDINNQNTNTLKKFLKSNNINYTCVIPEDKEDGNVEYNGKLSNTHVGYFENRKTLDIEIHTIFSNPNNFVDLELEVSNNVKAIEYKKCKLKQGYFLYTDDINGFDNIKLNITPNNMEKTICFDEITSALNTKLIHGDKTTINENFILYYYIEVEENEGKSIAKITISDEDQLNLYRNVKYFIQDYADISNISIMANNQGNFCNYLKNDSGYRVFKAYTDFSAYVSIAGVNVHDISTFDLGDYYGTIKIRENRVNKRIGYYISVTESIDKSEIIIDVKTYYVGDINLDGKIDMNDISILNRYITNQYQFIQTGSDGDLKIDANNVTINGDVSANGTLNITANNANINGTIQAKELVTNIPNGNFNYRKIEYGELFPMDIITSTFNDETMKKCYFEDAVTLDNYNTVIISNSPNEYSEEITVPYINNGSSIIFNGNFTLKKNQHTTESFYVVNSEIFETQSILYAENGNINITSNNVTINGFIYAPKGKVTITSNTLNITGTIIAKEIEIKSYSNLNFNISLIDCMNSIANGITLTEFQLMLADINFDQIINAFDAVLLRRRLF